MKRFGRFIGAIIVLQLIISPIVFAQSPDRGLLITPPRQYLEADPGKSTKSSVTVANLTENPLDVHLSVEQFSVADYTYDYMFESVKEDWIKLDQTNVTLKKSESRTISYTISLPSNATPGGHYFTIFASVSLGEGKQIRAATVLYMTVKGHLERNSAIVKATMPLISFGEDIPAQLDIKDTGNTHFIIYTSAALKGILPFPAPAPSETAHVLLPGKVRTITEKVSPPLLPGVYQATLGYRDEDGREVRQTQYVAFLPVWAIAVLLGGAWLVVALIKRRKRIRRETIDS